MFNHWRSWKPKISIKNKTSKSAACLQHKVWLSPSAWMSCIWQMYFMLSCDDFSLLPSVRSIVPSHMSRSIAARCWAPAGEETQRPGAFYSKRLRAEQWIHANMQNGCTNIKQLHVEYRKPCIMCSRKEKKRKALTRAEVKTSFLV